MCTCVSGALVKTHVLPAVAGGRTRDCAVCPLPGRRASGPHSRQPGWPGPWQHAWRLGLPDPRWWDVVLCPVSPLLAVCVRACLCVCLSVCSSPCLSFSLAPSFGLRPCLGVPGLASARAHLALLLAAGRVRALNAICLSVCRSQGSSRLWLTMGVVTRQGGEQSANNWLTAGHSW